MTLRMIFVQNPDEPAKKPELQAYELDLNQCGPMVSLSRQFVRLEVRKKAHTKPAPE